MKTLNIEAFAKSNRTLTILGKTYVVDEMSVENFIATTEEIEALGDQPTFLQQVKSSINMIKRYVPGIEDEVLRKLDIGQLMTIVRFVRGDMDESETPAAQAAEGEEKAGSAGK